MYKIIIQIVGSYWLDPNEGDVKDAILVHCDMKKKASCLLPKPERSPEIKYRGKEMEIWLGEIKDGMKVLNFVFLRIAIDFKTIF